MPNESAKIILAVTHGKLTKVKDAFAVEGTINALKVDFQFRTPDWDNTTKTVVFVRGRATPATTNADTTYVMLDENNECYVPPEILNGSMFSVGVFGTYDDYRIVSNWMCYKITDGCYADGSTPIDPSSTIYEQIISILKNKSDVNHKHDERYYTKDQSNGKFLTEEDLPVTSVNQKTGDVVLNAEDVGAFANTVDEQGNQVQTIPYAAIKDAPAQIQPDWNQNDSHSVDYIKNRPFYSNRQELLNLSLEDFTFHDDGSGMGYYTYEFSDPMYVDVSLDTINYYISGTMHSGEVFACNKTVNAHISEDGTFIDDTEYYYLTMSRNSDNNLSINLSESMGWQFQGTLTFMLYTEVIKQIPVEYIPVLQRPSENDNLPISAFYAGNLVEEKASELIDKVSSQIDKTSSELRDYVLDERPCYAEYTKADVIALQTKNFSYSSNEDVYHGFCNDTNSLINTACKVLWDDVIYDVVSSSDNRGYPCYGDKNLVEYPFYFVLAVSEAAGRVDGYNIYTNSTATSHTFRVYTETLSKVKQLDIACIPNEVKSLGLTGATVGQIVKVKEVDSSGRPTKWEAVEFPKRVQSDWNQNDETASDYIKNRPFGYYAIQDVILEEIPFTYKNTKEQTSISLIGSELIKSKSSIDVLTVVDEAFGERYDLPKRTIPEYTIDEYSCIGFGNVSLASSSLLDTGEKFLIGITGSDHVYVYRVVDESRVGTESSLTCLVSKPVCKKVDPDFLPTASSSKLGCGKVTVIDDSNTATKRNTKPIYIDSDGILYSGLTLPTSGSIGDIPVIKAIYYGDQYIYGRTTLGGFLDGVSSTNYYHQVSLDSSIRDIIFILTDRGDNLHKVTDLCLSIGNKDIVDISSEIGSDIGSDIKIHVQSIIKGYLSVKFYSGRVEREYNFLPYTLTSQATSKILKLYSRGHTSFTCTTYYNKIV